LQVILAQFEHIVFSIIWILCFNIAGGKMKIEDKYLGSSRVVDEGSFTEKRLDLNDLLERSKLQQKEDRRTNIIIVGGAFLVMFVVGLAILAI